MPTTTPLGDLPIPLDADPTEDGALAIRLLAAALDTQNLRKAADETVNNSTALQNDDHFLFAAEAGKTYVGEFFLIFTTVNSAIDCKIGFSFPAGTMSYGLTAMDPAVAAGVIGSGNYGAFSAAVSGVSAIAGGVASAETIVRVSFTYACTTDGTVRLMWAQNTLTASNLTMKAGSHMKVQVV